MLPQLNQQNVSRIWGSYVKVSGWNMFAFRSTWSEHSIHSGGISISDSSVKAEHVISVRDWPVAEPVDDSTTTTEHDEENVSRVHQKSVTHCVENLIKEKTIYCAPFVYNPNSLRFV